MKCTIALLLLVLVSTSSPAQTTPSPAQLPSSPARSTGGASPTATATPVTAASPEFEAATIKPVKEPEPGPHERPRGRPPLHHALHVAK